MRSRIAVVAAVVVFLLLAGTGVGYAYWSSNAQATGTVQAASLAANCSTSPAPTKLVNGGFEDPNITPNGFQSFGGPGFISGWKMVSGVIEVWRSQLGSTPPEGAQVIELNGDGLGTAYQVVATQPGQTLRWSLKHRGRFGPDRMQVAINADGAALVTQADFTTGNTAWSTQQGVYVVPAGQTSTRISLVSVSSTPEAGNPNVNTVGNLVDDVTFGAGPCLTSNSAIRNATTNTGTFRVGEVAEYTTTLTNTGGAHANSSVFTASVPAGLSYRPGSLVVNGVPKTDAVGDDQAEISGGTITARLGQGATGTAGGAVPPVNALTTPPTNAITVTFQADILPAAAGGNLVYNTSTGYVDALAPAWPLTVTSATVTTPVSAAADIRVTAQAPKLGIGSGGQTRSWIFTVTNLGPSSATGVSVTLTVPGTITADRAVAITGGGSCAAFSGNSVVCTIGGMTSASTRDITFTGRMPASPAGQYDVVAAATSTSYDPVSTNNNATGSATYDATAPSTPTGLSATRVSVGQINLSWSPSTDVGVGIAGYQVYRNGTLIATTTGTGTTFNNNSGLDPAKPYWYWVVAVDGAGNTSGQSAGDGAVTYANNTSYGVRYLNNTALCLAAPNVNPDGWLRTQDCTTTAATRQWMFDTSAGDDVYIRFASGDNRRWTAPDNTSGTDIRMSAPGDTSDGSRWNLGAYWTGTQAVMEVRRTTANTLCLDIDGSSTAAGASAQQWICNQTGAQRFELVQP